MGQTVFNIWNHLFGRRTFTIAMFGLRHSGKTRILYNLFGGKNDRTFFSIPTIGCNVETIEYNDVSFQIYDFSPAGVTNLFGIYKYVRIANRGVVFVVDSADRDIWSDMDYIDLVAEELAYCLDCDEWRKDAVLLIFANKQDLPGARTVEEIVDKLRLRSYPELNWHVQASTATEGIDLREGFDWMYNELVKK